MKKNKKFTHPSRVHGRIARSLGFAAVSWVSLALISCSSAQKKPLSASSLNPAGTGTVSVKSDPNSNTKLEVEVNHLAPPERIAPDAKNYVVWASPVESPEQARNLGSLQVDKDRSGKLAAVTPLRFFDLFVTAEPSPTQEMPTGERIFFTQVNNTRKS